MAVEVSCFRTILSVSQHTSSFVFLLYSHYARLPINISSSFGFEFIHPKSGIFNLIMRSSAIEVRSIVIEINHKPKSCFYKYKHCEVIHGRSGLTLAILRTIFSIAPPFTLTSTRYSPNAFNRPSSMPLALRSLTENSTSSGRITILAPSNDSAKTALIESATSAVDTDPKMYVNCDFESGSCRLPPG